MTIGATAVYVSLFLISPIVIPLEVVCGINENFTEPAAGLFAAGTGGFMPSVDAVLDDPLTARAARLAPMWITKHRDKLLFVNEYQIAALLCCNLPIVASQYIVNRTGAY